MTPLIDIVRSAQRDLQDAPSHPKPRYVSPIVQPGFRATEPLEIALREAGVNRMFARKDGRATN